MTAPKLRHALLLLPLMLLTGAEPATQPAERTTPTGLKIIETKVQTEQLVAKVGDTVWVHYTGRLPESAKPFDSSFDPGREAISFTLGARGIIDGLQQGIEGMKVGDKRQLIIPPNLGYGAEGRAPKIPPNATMVFDIELVGIYRK